MNNLKPFNLSEALAGKAVMLRNGQKAFVRHRETKLPALHDMVLLGYSEGGFVYAWAVDGVFCATRGRSGRDIISMYPETRIINGFEVPAPETAEPEHDTVYYIASPVNECLWSSETWTEHRVDKIWLSRGLVFPTKEDAIANTKAMLGINPHSEAES